MSSLDAGALRWTDRAVKVTVAPHLINLAYEPPPET